MRAGVYAIAASLAPVAAMGDTDWAKQISSGFEIVSALGAEKVLVRDREKFLQCILVEQENWIELSNCKPVMSASQWTESNMGEHVAALEDRVRSIEPVRDEVAFLTLFSGDNCSANLGRDADFEPAVFEVDPDLGDQAPLIRANLPSVDEVQARSKAVADFGKKLGFSIEEIGLVRERFYYRLNWMIQDSMQRGVVSDLGAGLFKLNKGCN